MSKKFVWIVIAILALFGTTFFWVNQNQAPAQIILQPAIPSPFPARTAQVIEIEDSPLKKSILEAGAYMVRQQLPNGELAYQVNILNDDRSYTPSDIRLMAGAGSLYTVCRISEDTTYCNAGDLALQHYLEMLVHNEQAFKGTCLYTNGTCPLGGSALTIDAIYKRWQATGSFVLDEANLLTTAIDLGYFVVSMRRAEGGFYHAFDPHFAGIANEDYFVTYFNGESLYALLQLYEMTENEFWLTQAHEINDFMLTQPITEDHWHSYALAMFARLDSLSQADLQYGNEIANVIIAGQVRSLNPVNTSISTATKIEALSALAQAFSLSNTPHAWLDREIRTFITFVLARQLPNNNCNFEITENIIKKYSGGIYSTCEDPSIRIDGLQHWVNGITTFLEYESMIEAK
jgi:hypothetical protein